MKITKTITLDFTGEQMPVQILAKQGDEGSRFLRIALTDGGNAYRPPEGATAEFRCVKPDGHGCWNTGEIQEDGTILLELTRQVLAVPGTVWADVGLKGADGKTLSTVSFRIWVCAVPVGEAIDSASEFLALTDLVCRGQAVLESLTGEGAELGQRLEELDQRISDLEYEPVEILSLSLRPAVAELGGSVPVLTVSWELNREPVSQWVNGTEHNVNLHQTAFYNVQSSGDYVLKVMDERGGTQTREARLEFVSGVYYGVLEDGATDSDAILGLTRKLQGNKAVTFAVNAGTGERIAFALPADYGTPEFHVGGFEGGFYQAQILDFTNGSGFTRQYALWLSDQTGLGETTVTVR